MNRIRQFVQQLTPGQLTWMAILLCIPAFLVNLGAVAFIGDEAIRTLVAFEMKHSGNFIVPTLNGIEYYNKPPLYNWIIYFVSTLFGYFGEWPTRLPTIIFLFFYAGVSYYFARKHFDKLTSITLAFMLLTSGRILFWDSMLGLIDICFSLVVFLNFMIIYHYGARGRWMMFFCLSYFLFGVAFLLKGLPAVVFQSISIVTALIIHRAFKSKFLSLQHLAGIAIGLLILLAYYIPYARQVSLENVFSILLDQSMQRTGTHHGLLKTIIHFFTFPIEQAYHFLPWSILLILFLHPRFRTWIRQDSFVRFNFWMLMANIPVYWLSVQVYPRYLLMFLPLFHVVGYYILRQSMTDNKRWWNIIRYVFIFLAVAATLAILLMPLEPRARVTDFIWITWLAGSVLMLFCLAGVIYDEARLFLWLCISLLVTRSVFNMVVVPNRQMEFSENRCREDCRRLGEKYGDHPWYIYGETETHQVARFYTSKYAGQIVRKSTTLHDPDAYYLVDTALYPSLPATILDSLLLEKGELIYLVQPFNQ